MPKLKLDSLILPLLALAGCLALWTVIAIQFVPLLALTGFISVYAWRRTNGALTGARFSRPPGPQSSRSSGLRP